MSRTIEKDAYGNTLRVETETDVVEPAWVQTATALAGLRTRVITETLMFRRIAKVIPRGCFTPRLARSDPFATEDAARGAPFSEFRAIRYPQPWYFDSMKYRTF